MRSNTNYWRILSSLALVLLILLSDLPWNAPPTSAQCQVYPQNVIVLIGDGMGFEQVKAAGMYLNGEAGTLSFEAMSYQAEMTTHSANSDVTDSAASGTAMATGFKVNNGVISLAIPGDFSELETTVEFYQDQGKSVGLVTTTYMTHATPAAFGAHETSRNSTSAIAGDYLNQTWPNVLFGGGANGMAASSASAAGYTVVSTRAEMQALDTESATMVSGQFGSSHLPYEYDGNYSSLPHLTEMTTTALDILDNDPDGFFLMVEGGRIDHAGHDNDLQRNIFETIEFADAVQMVLNWAQGRNDTMVVVTADHETGGLTVTQNNGQGNWPSVTWLTGNHTGANVPVYASGFNADMISGVMDNTDIHTVSTSTGDGPCPPLAAPSGLVAVAVSPVQIDLTWTDNAVNEEGLTIERSLDASTWTPIGTVGADVTSYSDAGLAASTTYHYRVYAYNGAGSSGYSNQASASTPHDPTAVTLERFEATGQAGTIALGWETASEVDNLGFHLYRAEAAHGSWTRLNADLIPVRNPGSPAGDRYEYLDAAVTGGVVYFYWLEMVDVHGDKTQYGPVSALTRRPLGLGRDLFLPLVVSSSGQVQ